MRIEDPQLLRAAEPGVVWVEVRRIARYVQDIGKAFMKGRDISIPVNGIQLGGELELSPQSIGIVIFAHGSGSSRHSPRNQYVARFLQEAGMGTLLFDLLTPEEGLAEARTGRLRFNIPLLAQRLAAATRWVLDRETTRDLNTGFFGASTGAAAALAAAAELGHAISAVVSRGGRPDLADASLDQVEAATLLVVGGNDGPVISANEDAYGRLHCEKALRIVPGASHLFEEPGALERVARMASDWFAHHLQPMALH
jgi:putative phosphoribosyl transferase